MEKILNFFSREKGETDGKKQFPKKALLKEMYHKSTLKANVNKLPLHILTNIFSFFDLETDQVQCSSINKKFKTTFQFCCKERETLILKASFPENIIYYLFHILPQFQNIKRLLFYNLTLDKTLLEDLICKSNLENLTTFKILNTKLIGDNKAIENDLTKFWEMIAKCKRLESINFNGFSGFNPKNGSNHGFDFKLILSSFESFQGLKKLIITGCYLKSRTSDNDQLRGEIDFFKCFPNIEYLDLSKNNLKFTFILNSEYITFGKSDKIKTIILRNNEINVTGRLPPNLFSEFTSNGVYPNYELIDISDNYITSIGNLDNFVNTFKNSFPNLVIKIDQMKLKKEREMVMRMLFSRSGVLEQNQFNINNENNENEYDFNKYENLHVREEIIGSESRYSNNHISYNKSIKNKVKNEFEFSSYAKYLGKKTNGAVLPCIVYKSPAKILINKATLIKILNAENSLRLSDFAKSAYDENCEKDKNFHLNLDLLLIKKALSLSGFSPDTDDSLKAYHLATKQFISDPEVFNSVVWMKYDKCKIGKYAIGDKPDYKNIKVYDINNNESLLKNLIYSNYNNNPNRNSNKIFNLIVSGSLS